jgi:hypothetical protein
MRSKRGERQERLFFMGAIAGRRSAAIWGAVLRQALRRLVPQRFIV